MIPKKLAPAKAGGADFSDKIMRKINQDTEETFSGKVMRKATRSCASFGLS
jgi:hypothetical protein